jgi:hypothetical protein
VQQPRQQQQQQHSPCLLCVLVGVPQHSKCLKHSLCVGCVAAGATGGVGKRVVQQLLAQGRVVRALVRDVDKARQLLVSGCYRERESSYMWVQSPVMISRTLQWKMPQILYVVICTRPCMYPVAPNCPASFSDVLCGCCPCHMYCVKGCLLAST